MGEAKSKVFKVNAKGSQLAFAQNDEVIEFRLVRAKRIPQVEAHIAQDFEITVATPDDLYVAGKTGIAIEEASE